MKILACKLAKRSVKTIQREILTKLRCTEQLSVNLKKYRLTVATSAMLVYHFGQRSQTWSCIWIRIHTSGKQSIGKYSLEIEN